jgi:hypothetical protein
VDYDHPVGSLRTTVLEPQSTRHVPNPAPARRDHSLSSTIADGVRPASSEFVLPEGSDLPIPIESLTSFDHVLWIGGSPDSGKTSVAGSLADRYSLGRYHFDRHEPAHFGRAGPDRHPALWAAHPDRMSTEQRWLGSPPGEMAAATIASWSERFWMALDDLLEMPAGRIIVAEGPGFFPELLAPLLPDSRRAIWLIPSEDFKRDSAARRGKPGNRHETSDPVRAARNLVERDLLMGGHIRARCVALGLRYIEVTGQEGVDAITRQVEEWFSPLLGSLRS